MFKNYFLLLLFCAFCRSVSGQNLVLNPSFEEFTVCPTSLGIISSDGFVGGGGQTPPTHWINPTHASPDYFNICDTSGIVGVPSNFAGFQTPHSGSAYAGLVTYSRFNWFEYLTGKLEQPTIPGRTYELSFWVNCSGYGLYAMNHLALALTPTLQSFSVFSPISLTPQLLAQDVVTDTANWTQISTSWTATDSMRFVTLGFFAPDGLKNLNFDTLASGNENQAYYYFDDVSVVEVSPLVVSPNVQKCVSDTVLLTASGDGIDYYWEPEGVSGDTVIVWPSQTTTYTVTMTRASGTTQTATVMVIVGSDAIMTDLPDCVEIGSGVFELIGFPEGGSFSGAGMVGNEWNPDSLAPGITTITYSGHNACGEYSVSQTVNIRPTVSIPNLPDSICSNDQNKIIHLIGSPPGGVFSGAGVFNNLFYPQLASNGSIISYSGFDVCPFTYYKQVTIVQSQAYVSTSNSFNGLYYPDTALTLFGNPPGGVFSGVGVSGNTFNVNGLAPGTYNVTYKGVSFCGPYSVTYPIIYFGDTTVSVESDEYGHIQALYYPNPVGDQLTISLLSDPTSEPVEFSLFTLEGALVLSKQWNGLETPKTIDLPELLPGVYIAKLREAGRNHFSKIIKTNSK